MERITKLLAFIAICQAALILGLTLLLAFGWNAFEQQQRAQQEANRRQARLASLLEAQSQRSLAEVESLRARRNARPNKGDPLSKIDHALQTGDIILDEGLLLSENLFFSTREVAKLLRPASHK